VKTTIDIPEEVYRRVKAKSALQGRRVREVTLDLYRRWLDEDVEDPSACGPATAWLDEFLRHGEAAGRNMPPGPTASAVLASDRGRLDGT
jgi:hypothetical protein